MLDRIARHEGGEPKRNDERFPRRLRGDERPRRPSRPPLSPKQRKLTWAALLLVALVVVAALVARNLDEFLRRTLETKINQALHGYTVSLGSAHLSLLDLSLTLGDTLIRQQAHPEPPVAALPEATAGVEWRELLRFHLVADAIFDRPRIHLNLPQMRAEDRDQVEVQDRGWQDALAAIYPLKFNRVEVRDGEVVYVDTDPRRPLHLARVNARAENIRNVRSAPGTYPSPIHADAVIFGTGRGVLDGHADFLAEPTPGVHAVYRVENVPLDRLRPLGDRANLRVKGGTLDSRGEFEVGPAHREVRIDDVTARRLQLDYVHTAATAEAEKERGQKVAEAAKDKRPETPVRILRLRLTDSELGMVDRSKDRPYRLYVDGTDLTVTNLSSGFTAGPARAKLTGRFMGTGSARGDATFRPDRQGGPDFEIDAAVEGAALPTINDLLRNYGKLDVAGGTFSVYTEIAVHEGRIDGYVKPLFKDVDVYDSEQDKDKPVLKKLYEKIVGGVSHLLENRPRDEVATVVDISGPLEDPQSSTWDTVVRLLSNAFVKAILPGFEREAESARKHPRSREEPQENSKK